jgi:hypothetical protein
VDLSRVQVHLVVYVPKSACEIGYLPILLVVRNEVVPINDVPEMRKALNPYQHTWDNSPQAHTSDTTTTFFGFPMLLFSIRRAFLAMFFVHKRSGKNWYSDCHGANPSRITAPPQLSEFSKTGSYTKAVSSHSRMPVRDSPRSTSSSPLSRRDCSCSHLCFDLSQLSYLQNRKSESKGA